MNDDETQISQKDIQGLLNQLLDYGMNLTSYNDNVATVNPTDNPNELATKTTGLAIMPKGTEPNGKTHYLGYDTQAQQFRELTHLDIVRARDALDSWLSFNELRPLHRGRPYPVPVTVRPDDFSYYRNGDASQRATFRDWLNDEKRGINAYLRKYRGKPYSAHTMQDNIHDHLIQGLVIDSETGAVRFQIPAFRLKDGEFNNQLLDYPATGRDYINPYGKDYDPICPPGCIDYEDAVIDDGDDRMVRFVMKPTDRPTKLTDDLQFGDVIAVGSGDWHIYLPE